MEESAILVFVVFALTSLWFVAEAQERGECFVFARVDESNPCVSDMDECGLKTAPASTFKIPHALIALQAGVVTPETIFKWDGMPHDFEAWRRDHTLSSAMKWSVVPFFQHTGWARG